MLRKCFQLALTIAFAFVLSSCSQNPGKWNAAKIESWIEKEWNLTTITVEEHQDGSFSGNGTDRSGKSYTFKVEQKPETKELWCAQFDEHGDIVTARAVRKF